MAPYAGGKGGAPSEDQGGLVKSEHVGGLAPPVGEGRLGPSTRGGGLAPSDGEPPAESRDQVKKEAGEDWGLFVGEGGLVFIIYDGAESSLS